MRLISYGYEQGWRAGVVRDGRLFDATALLSNGRSASSSARPVSVRALLSGGTEVLERLEDEVLRRAADGSDGLRVSEVRVGPPVPDPEKIICLGLNYRDHAEEAGLELPVAPMLFAKFRNSLVGALDEIVLPAASGRVDYEAELAVVIGRRAKDVGEAEALDHVAGVMALNDVSARDLQLQTSQWMAGKAIDTFAPCGPALVLLDEIEDVQALGVRTRVNGRTVQDGTTADMIFSVASTVAWLSGLMTLEPGDVIATGTPAGVGFKREPPVLLQPGDLVEVEIDQVGTLHNPVVAARDRSETPGRQQTAEAR